jgi:hypothetical protein
MEAADFYGTLVTTYKTTRRHNPEDHNPVVKVMKISEDSHLRTHRRENLKSYYENIKSHMMCLLAKIAHRLK